jgi:hypothetical protein
MSSVPVYGRGADIRVRARLEIDDVAEPLLDAVVQAALYQPGIAGRAGGTAVITATVLNPAATQPSDTDCGVVEAVWPAANTGTVPAGRLVVQFRATRGGQIYDFQPMPIDVYEGRIP